MVPGWRKVPVGEKEEARGGESSSGSVDELLVHIPEASAENGAKANEKHATQLMIVVHEKLQLGP
jgi:hypothetical protein